MIKLPGLIDIHVHLRTPGQEEKEDFYTGTQAALAGGFTTILDMPNNKIPITTLSLLEEKMTLAQGHPVLDTGSNHIDSRLRGNDGGGIVCDVGFHFGSLGDNLNEFQNISQMVFGLKLYLNPTTGNYLIDEEKLQAIYETWPSSQPILLHCEGETLLMAMEVIRKTKKPTHICHVSSQEELSTIMAAKDKGLPITCGVTPHHLFLTEKDQEKLGPFGLMKPSLKNSEDVQFLWDNLNSIDIIESDHAPHTLEEKNNPPAGGPPFGIPGLETTLPLLLTAVGEGKLSIEDIKRLCHTNPARIFNIKTDENTYVEIDETVTYTLNPETFYTKCKWSPFAGRMVKGKVKTVYLRGIKVFEDGKVLAKKGSGKIIKPL